MITGHDSVLISAGRLGPAVRRFGEAWSKRWPDMRVEILDGSAGFQGWRAAADGVPAGKADLLFVRDEQMASEFGVDYGYELTERGDGPFMLMYQPCQADRFQVEIRQNPYTPDEIEPYEAIVIGAGINLVTVVAPDSESQFSQDLLEAWTVAFAGEMTQKSG